MLRAWRYGVTARVVHGSETAFASAGWLLGEVTPRLMRLEAYLEGSVIRVDPSVETPGHRRALQPGHGRSRFTLRISFVPTG